MLSNQEKFNLVWLEEGKKYPYRSDEHDAKRDNTDNISKSMVGIFMHNFSIICY